MLESLELRHVGPAPRMALDLAPRLNVITGDNGLGKSFLLDVAWWALTRTWAREMVVPHPGAKGTGDIVDPFKVQPGWFELDLGTCLVRRGKAAPPEEYERIESTLTILNLRQCIAQRLEYVGSYRMGDADLAGVERYAPFIASELRRQGLPTRRGRR